MNNFDLLLCIEQEGHGIDEGTWDAIHVVTTNVQGQQVFYQAVSTVFVMIKMNQYVGAMSVGGHLNKKKDISYNLDAKQDIGQQHISNIGKLVENIETEIRSDVHGIVLNKPKGIINYSRYMAGLEQSDQKAAHQQELLAMLKANKNK